MIARYAIVGACVVAMASMSACRLRGSNLSEDSNSGVKAGSTQPFDWEGDPSWRQWMEEFNSYSSVLTEKGPMDLPDEGAKIGRYVWYFGTVGNAKYHSTMLPQAMGFRADYYDVFKTERRGKSRFKKWGVIPDPSCRPGNASSFYFDICPGDLGDSGLLNAVGKPDQWAGYDKNKQGYWKNDPACKIAGDCRLAFGTSAGAVGFRKFPNPRFNAKKWEKIGGWDGYTKKNDGKNWTHLNDDSIEPPFLIGHACGSCHISYNPEKPPRSVEEPQWANIEGAIGAQYLQISRILGSGMPIDSLEWQVFTHSRQGTSDTSAVTHDGVNNPGTMNPIMNFSARPGLANFLPDVLGTVKDENELDLSKHTHNYAYFDFFGEDTPSWKTAGEHALMPRVVPHILKGGEDTVGAVGAVQRVYLNIGMCAESCMLNHLQDLKALAGRKSRQTPMRLDQCMRDCPEYRSISRQTVNIAKFLVAQQPAELYRAMGMKSRDELVTKLGTQQVELGAKIFAANCTKCHSSRISKQGAQDPAQLAERFTQKVDENGRENPDYLFRTDERGIRVDWLGNDEYTEATEVGTFKCRAVHSNHMQGHLWEQYGSSTLRARAKPSMPEMAAPANGPDGRGYYRNISLISAWAFAPFMHNNAIGTEICNDAEFKSPVPNEWGRCMSMEPAVQVGAREELFEQSFKQLMGLERRQFKVTRTDYPINFPIGPSFKYMGQNWGMAMSVPAGVSTSLMGSIDHRAMVKRVVADVNARGIENWRAGLPTSPNEFEGLFLSRDYVNCGGRGQTINAVDEAQGHDQGIMSFDENAATDPLDRVLNRDEFAALSAFMKTL